MTDQPKEAPIGDFATDPITQDVLHAYGIDSTKFAHENVAGDFDPRVSGQFGPSELQADERAIIERGYRQDK